MIILPKNDNDLLDECDIETFRSSGAGGQHINKTDSAVRLRHRPSGIVVTSRTERSQHKNKMDCIRKIREKAAALNYIPPKRKATKISKAAKEKRLEKKAKNSKRKKERKNIDFD